RVVRRAPGRACRAAHARRAARSASAGDPVPAAPASSGQRGLGHFDRLLEKGRTPIALLARLLDAPLYAETRVRPGRLELPLERVAPLFRRRVEPLELLRRLVRDPPALCLGRA